MNQALLMLLADGGAVRYGTWSPWYAVIAWVATFALIIWLRHKALTDPVIGNPPDNDNR